MTMNNTVLVYKGSEIQTTSYRTYQAMNDISVKRFSPSAVVTTVTILVNIVVHYVYSYVYEETINTKTYHIIYYY